MEWGSEQERAAEDSVRENSSLQLSPDVCGKYEEEAAGYWDGFYQQHQNRCVETWNTKQ